MKCKSNLVLKEDGDDAVLFDPEVPISIILNKTGIDIWKNLQKGLSIKEIFLLLKDTYDINESILFKDIETFVHKLIITAFIEEEN